MTSDTAAPVPAMADTPHLIRDLDTLLARYGEPVGAAVAKELPYIHPHYRRFIEAAPFVSVATSGPGGLDNSPRGDAPGFSVRRELRSRPRDRYSLATPCASGAPPLALQS